MEQFRHATRSYTTCHREVLYDRIPPRRRARLHVRIGEKIETGYGVQAREFAAELAVHFVQGQDVPRAVRYLRHAGEHAAARSGHRETVELLRQALKPRREPARIRGACRT